MIVSTYLFTLVGYIFIQHSIGKQALKLIALESKSSNSLIEYEKKNELLKAWSLILLAFDSDSILDEYPIHLKGYIYAYRVMFFGFPIFAIALVVLFGLEVPK